ncbi:uncharacterized protein LOC119732829 [Patiria miniata]|uniref:Endonuclease/exonuclease/phosphatase domain-containing protein n=1 Tax=Patiria miniata TaxID=46514 RepID=A0A914AFS8_PATMI|nr:uncharacterized protein LOC119732829 [Patiria miniata]
MEELELVLHSNKVDIAIATETWFTDATTQVANIPTFTTISKSRPNKRGGGVAIFAKDHLSVHTLSDHVCELECMWLKLDVKKARCSVASLYIGVIYYPPNSTSECKILDHICNTVDHIRASDMSAIITLFGDFNGLKCDPIEANLSMTQLISFPTRGNATLDKIFTNFPVLFKEPERLPPLGASDHCCVLLSAVCELPQQKKGATSFRPYRDSSVRSFGQWIVDYDWSSALTDSCTDSVGNFLTTVTDAYNFHFPLVTSTLQNNDKPWMTHRLKQLVKQRQHAFRSGNMDKWRSLRSKIRREIRTAKCEFYKHTVQHLKCSQPGKWHRQIQKLCQIKSKCTMIPGADVDPETTSETINGHFADICNQLPALDLQGLPSYLPAKSPPPLIYRGQVLKTLKRLKPIKAGHPSDLPVRLISEFAYELADPLTDLFVQCLPT